MKVFICIISCVHRKRVEWINTKFMAGTTCSKAPGQRSCFRVTYIYIVSISYSQK